jgi:hypothetical protein
MQFGVARSAKCDQIFFAIVARVAPEFLVMNLQVGYRSAQLASPAVAAQHLFTKLRVKDRIQPQARTLLQNPIEDAFSVAW